MTTLTAEQVEVPADPVGLYERSLEERWGDGAPILPPTVSARNPTLKHSSVVSISVISSGVTVPTGSVTAASP